MNKIIMQTGGTDDNPPAMWEIWVRSLGWEDPLEKNQKYPHSRLLAWEIPRTEEPDGLQSMGLQRFRHDYVTNQLINNKNN